MPDPIDTVKAPVMGLALRPGGPLETFIKGRLMKHLEAQGATPADAEAAIAQLTSEHPLLDWFMQYGLPYILQLLSNLLIKPIPIPIPTPTP